MIKKIAIYATIFVAFAALLVSCKKKEIPGSNLLVPKSKLNLSEFASIDYNSTIGDLHNFIVLKYIEQYDLNDGSTPSIYSSNILRDRIVDIAISENIIDSAKIPLFIEAIDSMQSTLGIITPTNTLRPLNEVIPIVLAELHDNALKIELDNILDSMILDNLPSVANTCNRLRNIEGLDSTDELAVENFASVLESSYTLWNETPYPSSTSKNAGEVAAADAIAAMHVTLWGIRHGQMPEDVKWLAAQAAAHNSKEAAKW